MEKVTFINKLGKKVILGDEAPYILTKIDGVGAVEADIQMQKAPFQDGVTYLGNSLNVRNISLQIEILSDNLNDMVRKRQELMRVFNTKSDEGILVYELGNLKRKVRAKVEKGPEFIYNKNFMDNMQSTVIELYCSDPFWYELELKEEEMADWIGGLRFPLQLPMVFAGRSTRQYKVINNAGDAETPVTFIFTGPCVNPKVVNVDTGEFIKVNTSLGVDERLIITTAFGDKKVELENVNMKEKVNAFHLIDIESTFFQLKLGDNLISYSADEGQETAKVWINWSNRYVGV